MNEKTTLAGSVSPKSEINHEGEKLSKSIAGASDLVNQLASLLSPVRIQHAVPAPPQNKDQEDTLSPMGSTIREYRQSMDGINSILSDIINSLAI